MASAPLLLLLGACSGPDRPPVDGVTDALVAALSARDLSGLPMRVGGSVDAQTQLDQILEPLEKATGERTRSVTVADVGSAVEEDGNVTVPVTLDWTWELAQGTTWDYDTTVDLAYVPPAASDDEGSWQVVWRPDVLVPDLAPGERLKVRKLGADRADVLDGADEPMVTARDVWHLGVDKTLVEGLGLESAARGLAVLVGIEPNEYFAKVEAAGDKAFVKAITVRDVDAGVDFTVDEARAIPGVRAIDDTLELAPYGSFAAPVLGRSGEATKEIIAESEGRVQAGDVAGLTGLQRQYDEQLAGVPGVVVQVVSPDGSAKALDGSAAAADEEEPRDLFRVDAVDGTPVRTTLDVDVQTRAEDVLDDVDPASAIVAIEPSTGEVLAAASGPGSEGWSTATLGQYPPGSTFKIVDALAMQRAGLTADSPVRCSDTITVDGRTFGNVPGYPASALGKVPLSKAFAHSCNTAMIAQRDVVSQADLAAAATGLGLVGDKAATAALGVPAFLGAVPSEAGETEHAASLIGQGKVQTSPLGMATVAAGVVAGAPVHPVLVRPAEDAEAPETPKGAVTKDEAAVIRDLMHGVVTDGSADILRDVDGVLGAKTGTAQYGDGSKQHVWMVAIMKDLAVAVFVEDGHRGSDTAGPLMHEFLESVG
ncbi:penicillin-binding protein [Isoptericola sp. NEAU-Y5]|uniref:Beta-lactamase n=1 Tax=Isoptericola luteus TaxID=2879484 RepID=A0ABS7ZHJ3_9MICO|nr:penicillin-binding transpeptidase domain-containing protein [Isoptericola sp. NEAU-Y5]MCA5894482.1 penicillin-binding protein [Isoptericola sp. NEAU-Y5]